ncbi:MAG: FAD-dependent oxidoreductase [Alphaproteobacteria bacterium]
MVGGGVAGLGCAWLLSKRHDVTLYESASRLGGHSHTVDLTVAGKSIAVDTGFIVYNDVNYPNLIALFDALAVPTEPSDMSFSVSLDGGRFEYASPLPGGPFCQPTNILRPHFLRMLADIVRFYRHAHRAQRLGTVDGATVRELLERGGYSKTYWYLHLLPMASAIWSTPIEQILAFDASSFIRFYDEHGLLRFRNRPKWRTVTGGSREYVRRLAAEISGSLLLNAAVRKVHRKLHGVVVTTDQDESVFDQVVFATHADRTAAILGDDLSAPERAALGAFNYARSDIVVHGDARQMPRRRGAWSSWNYQAQTGMDPARPVPVTYWMNRLQNVDRGTPLFASLNPWQPPRDDRVYGRYVYEHPVFSQESVVAQNALSNLQGRQRTWYCGAYCGFGFHEDALKSGIRVARSLGAEPPWQTQDAAAYPALETVP